MAASTTGSFLLGFPQERAAESLHLAAAGAPSTKSVGAEGSPVPSNGQHPPVLRSCSGGSARSCTVSYNWKCLTAWIMKRNPQLPHWGWIATTGILQHSTTAPNHFPWPLKRRIRKPGFALSSQEEGIKVKYQWPGIGKGLVFSFIVTFFLTHPFLERWLFRACLTFASTSSEVALLSGDNVWLRLTIGLQKIHLYAVLACHITLNS